MSVFQAEVLNLIIWTDHRLRFHEEIEEKKRIVNRHAQN